MAANRLGFVSHLDLSLGGPLLASPASAAGQYLSQVKGFDACVTPSTSEMQTWFSDSPYWNYFVYIGGSNRSNCGGASVTSSWVSTVIGQDWQLVFVWVGPQMPYGTCQTHDTYNDYVSLDTSTAYNQGWDQAKSAYSELKNLNVNVNNAPVVYDLEYYHGGTTCRAAAKSFMKGWADYLDQSPSQYSGAYGSACASYINDFASDGNPPEFVWPGDGSTGESTGTISCIPSGNWVNHQRHKQYSGGHLETYGGVTMNIDNDCSDGPVYGSFGNLLDGTCL
jgi:hypothetical protein